jgi:hypothetical protein
MFEPDEPEPWRDDSTPEHLFATTPRWEPWLAGPVYALFARDALAEDEIDCILAQLGLA